MKLWKPVIWKANALTILAFVSLGANASAQAQGQTQQGPQPCSATNSTATTNPGSNSPANNAATAVKNIGSLFHKNKTNANTANASPCAPTSASPANPGAKQPTGGSPGAGVNFSGPFTPPAGTKVEATLLAPFAQGDTFQVSPHGVHAASMTHKGSRLQIIYDGVAGPVFDGFTGFVTAPVSFSPDGNHFGYCGFASQQFAVIVDGKQVGGGPQVTDQYSCSVFFSPNSRHFFYTMSTAGNGRDIYIRLVMDGKSELHLGDFNPQSMSWSPDGDHYAMLVDPYPGNGRNIQPLVVDGRPSSLPGGAPTWSADSKHLYTLANSQQGQTLLLDGKPILTANRIVLTVPPVGNMAVMAAYLTNGGRGGVLEEVWYLAVNGKRVPGSEIVRPRTAGRGGQINQVFISPDGKHYAAICIGVNSKMYIFADGKKGLDYVRVDKFVGFTAESAKPVYAGLNGREYLVVGDQESPLPDGGEIPAISPTGDHVAADGLGLTLDGQPLNLVGNPQMPRVSGFNFSPDGAHYSFLLQSRGGAFTAFVDNVPQAAYTWVGVGAQTRNLWNAGHVAYFCRVADPSAPDEYGLCVDGKFAYFGRNPVYENLTFTPDGNHVFFDANKYAQGFRLFMDGQPVLDAFHSGVGWGPGTWEMESDGTLEILTQDNTGLKRYSITPPAGSSLAALMGGGAPASAAKH